MPVLEIKDGEEPVLANIVSIMMGIGNLISFPNSKGNRVTCIRADN